MVFNLGSQEEVSVNELAQRVIAKTGSASKVRYIPYEQAYPAGFEDMEHRVPNVSRIQKALGFSPKYNLDSILDDVIAEFRDKLYLLEQNGASLREETTVGGEVQSTSCTNTSR